MPEVRHDMPEGGPVQHQGGGHQPVVGQHRLHQAQAHTSGAQQHLHLVTEIYYILHTIPLIDLSKPYLNKFRRQPVGSISDVVIFCQARNTLGQPGVNPPGEKNESINNV